MSALLSVVIGAAFAVLALAIDDLRGSNARATHALEVLASANRLQRLIVAVNADERGFLLSGNPVFLKSYHRDQAEFTRQAAVAERLARAGDAGQGRRAHEITRAGTSFITNYSNPLLALAQQDLNAARMDASTTVGGHRQLVALRVMFDQLTAREQKLFASGHDRAEASANRALVIATASVAGSILLILVSGGYIARSVVRPVRRASVMAGRLADGELTVRVPETGPGEVGGLERSLNSMASSLKTSRDELAASRARVIAASDETRRRIERDLHDGIQQRLISVAIGLRSEVPAPGGQQGQAGQLSRTAEELNATIEELRELSQGLHPVILERAGLGPALKALARRAGVPVELSVDIRGRLPERTEVTAYYVVSEALTNVAKHARASVAVVEVSVADEVLRVVVRDNGAGGADPARGSGLIGLSDRVGAAGGQIQVASLPGAGTTLLATIPLTPG